MNLYEGLFLLDSNLVSKDWPALEKHIQDILTRHGAELLHTERWPERRLAYEVKGCKKGTYFLVYFNAPGTAIAEINRDVQISERILRVMMISEAGIEEELERRKNREVASPPAELSYPRDRGSFGRGDRPRREPPPHRRAETTTKPREAKPEETPERAPEESGVGAVAGEDAPEAGKENAP